MTVISKRFADELSEKEMRDAYLSAQTRTKLTNQIRAIRSQRGWSQGEFAKRLDKPQSNVSRLENREYGSFTLNTLFELASAFDVGLVVEFVQYDDFLRRTHDLSPSHLQVQSFSRASLETLCLNGVATEKDATVLQECDDEDVADTVETGDVAEPDEGIFSGAVVIAPLKTGAVDVYATGSTGITVSSSASELGNATTINRGFPGGPPIIALNQFGSGIQSVAFGD
jgi:transcriptional regulator with XRE-family HTH domain